jgi:hypothetical protein
LHYSFLRCSVRGHARALYSRCSRQGIFKCAFGDIDETRGAARATCCRHCNEQYPPTG